MEDRKDNGHVGTKEQTSNLNKEDKDKRQRKLGRGGSSLHHRHRAQSIIQFQSLDQLEDEVTHGFYETTPPKKGSHKRVIIMDIIYGIYWWACFNNLSSLLYKDSPLLLWQQACIIGTILIAIILFGCVGVFRQLCSTPFGLLCLRMITLLLSFHTSIWLVSCLGGVACILAIFSSLWNMSSLDRYRRIHCHLLAFVCLQIIHFNFPQTFLLSQQLTTALSTLHWTTLIIFCVSLLTVLVTFIQDYRTPLVTRDDLYSNKSPPYYDGTIEWVWLGAGFGCHLYIARSIFGGSGLLINWMDFHSSFPIKVLLIAVLCVGVLLGNEKNLPLITSPQWLLMGLLSCIGFIYYLSSAAIIGAIMTFFHLMSIWPQLYYRLPEAMPSIVFPVAIATYLVTLMLSQLSLGGVGFHGYGIICSIVIEWYSLKRWLPLGEKLGKIKLKIETTPIKRRPSYTMMVGQMIRRLSTVSEQDEESDEKGTSTNTVHQRRLLELLNEQETEMKHFEAKKLRKIMIGLVVLALLSAAAAYK